MKVELHNSFKKPMTVDATRVVIYSDFGDPLMMTLEIQPGHWKTFRAGDEEFEEKLVEYGITKTVFVSNLDPKTLREESTSRSPSIYHSHFDS